MSMRLGTILSILILLGGLLACSSNTNRAERTLFTKADSVTDTYLMLQDTLYNAWSLLIKDENQKISNLNSLVEHLMNGNHFEKVTLSSLNDRIDQLCKIKISQKSLANPYVVEEYDLACSSIITEVLSLAEAKPELLTDKYVQNLVDNIKNADQRVSTYRSNYDSVAELFNTFIESNRSLLEEIDRKFNLEKRPQFKEGN